MRKAEQAVANHKNHYPCSTAVLSAFAETAGLSEKEALLIAKPMAGGRMGKCGAVLAAEYVLEKIYGEEAEAKKQELERRFMEMNRSVVCRELKGIGTGKVLCSCRQCVTDAAELLEEFCNQSE
ncbi:MAG: C-GCAxxG-C-C family protein [Oscillospiraceae bacterium]